MLTVIVLSATIFHIYSWVHVLQIWIILYIHRLMSILLTLHNLPEHESQWPQNNLLMCYRICLTILLLVDIQVAIILYFIIKIILG